MKTKIKTTFFKQTAATTALVEEKLATPAEKLLHALDEAANIMLDVELAKVTKHHRKGNVWRCEVNVSFPAFKKVLRAEALGKSLDEAVNITKYELEREIKKYKGKFIAQRRTGKRARKYGP